MQHVHINAMHLLITMAYMIIATFIMRMASIRWHDKPIGQALDFLF